MVNVIIRRVFKKIDKFDWALFVFLFALIFILFWPALKLGFFSDDYDFLNMMSRETNIFRYFLTNNVGEVGGGSYGPVLNLIFFLQYKLFGLKAFWYHLVSLLAYWFSGILVYFFAKEFADKKWLAGLTAIFFITLQSHISTVVWMAAQPHLFSTFFYLLGLYLYLLFIKKENKYLYILALFSFFSSLLIKEVAMTFPAMLLLLELFFGKDAVSLKEKSFVLMKRLFLPILFFIFYFLIRRIIVGYTIGYYAQENLIFDFVKMCKMFIELSIGIFFSYPKRVIISDWFFYHKIFSCFLIFILFFSTFFWKEKKKAFFLILSYVILILPFLSLNFNALSDEGERYTYLISIFFSLLIVFLVDFVFYKKRFFSIYVLIIFLFFFISLYQHNKKINYWQIGDSIVKNGLNQFGDLYISEDNRIIFVALPDNLHGVPLFRNATIEAINLSKNKKYHNTDRILLETFFHLGNFDRKILDIKQEDDLIKFSSVSNERVFTGFPRFKNEIGEFILNDFDMNIGHTGTSIEIRLNLEKIKQYTDVQKKVIIVYYDEGKFNKIELN